MDSSTIEHLQTLAAEALAPDLAPTVRVNRLRTLAELVADVRDASTAAAFILPGAAFTAATEKRDLWADIAALLPLANSTDPIAATSGTLNSFGIIRGLATPLSRQVVPGLSDPTKAGEVNTSTMDLDPVAITNVIPGNGRPDIAGAAFTLTQQILKYIDLAGQQMLDQITADVVDRAAEQHVGNSLITAATPLEGVHATLIDQLDAAESQASAGAGSVADLLMVNPADWPAIRRAVAPTWTDAVPHPTAVLSVGIPVGEVVLGASAAFVVQADPLQHLNADQPKVMGAAVAVLREFRTVVRLASGLVTFTR